MISTSGWPRGNVNRKDWCEVRHIKTDKAGEFYNRALTALLEEFAFIDDAVLVHGYPRITAKGECFGDKFGHAWIEIGDGVLDCGSFDGDDTKLILKARYYRIGKIDPKECTRYNRSEAARLALDTGMAFWTPDDLVP